MIFGATIRRVALAALLALSLAPAVAQVAPPVPALPDTERRTSYTISASTCSCSVGFQLYGDSTNIDAWIEVWVGGTRYLSTDTAHGWSLSSATGSLATIPRPITNAVLTFNAAQTGVVQIVGARRPQRVSQFAENQGVPARNLNQVLTDIVAQNRETWDRTNDVTGRALLTKPGDTIGQLPVAASRASTALGFDSSGNPIALSPALGIGTIIGPSSSVDGHVLCFNGTSGQLARDCGPSVGTVLSVGLSLPGIFSVTGSPVTSTGTLTAALATQTANFVWAGPTTGSAASPAFRALVGADLPLPGASSLGGTFSKAAVTSNWLRSLGTDGALTASQPAFTDISGVASAAQLPTPTASTLGGVQSYAPVSNQWINTISTAGVPSSTQPAFSNLSGSVASTQMPALTGDVTTSAGAVATTIAANAVTNAKAAQMGAATIKCNPTNATVNSQDCTIQGLPARGAPDAVNDKIPLFDNAAGTIKFVTPNQIASASTAGVSSLNGLSGGLSIAPGSGISVSAAGSLVTVSNTAPRASMVTVYNDGTNWVARKPDGTFISTGSTMTCGIQEALTYAYDPAVNSSVAFIGRGAGLSCTPTTTISVPAQSGNSFYCFGAYFVMNAAIGVQFDTQRYGGWYCDGAVTNYQATGAAYYTSPANGAGAVGCTASGCWGLDYDFHFGTILYSGVGITASQSGTVLTVSAVARGKLQVGSIIPAGQGVSADTTILSLGTGTGTTGTYNVDVSATVGSTSMQAGGGQCWLAALNTNGADQITSSQFVANRAKLTCEGQNLAKYCIQLSTPAGSNNAGGENIIDFKNLEGCYLAQIKIGNVSALDGAWGTNHYNGNIAITGSHASTRGIDTNSSVGDIFKLTSLNCYQSVGSQLNVGWGPNASGNVIETTQAIACGGGLEGGTAQTFALNNWFNGILRSYTPTLACGSGSLTTASATGRAVRIAPNTLSKLVWFSASAVVTTNGTCATNLQISLPTGASASSNTPVWGMTTDTGTPAYAYIGNSYGNANMTTLSNTYPGGSGHTTIVSGTYEIP